MAAFGPNFPNFRAIWLGTTKPKLQNRYGAADQNIQTFISNLGYLHREDIGSTSLRKYPDNLKTITKALVQRVLKTLVQVIRLS